MYLRLARAAPQAARRARRLLGAKDWLFWRLTGEPATDPSTASGFGCYGLEAGAWLEDVVAAAGGLFDATAGAAASPGGHPGLPALPAVLPSLTVRRVSTAIGDPAWPARRSAGLPRRRRLGAGLPRAGRRAAGRRRLRGRHQHRLSGRRRPAPGRPRAPLPDHTAGRHRRLGFRDGPAHHGQCLSLAGRPAARGRRRRGGPHDAGRGRRARRRRPVVSAVPLARRAGRPLGPDLRARCSA